MGVGVPRLTAMAGGLWVGLLIGAGPAAAAVDRRPDPARVLPIEQIAPERREEVAEIIRENHFHRQGKADSFPCHPKLYLALLNQPVLTLALWQDLSGSPAKLRQIGPHQFHGEDGAGTSATWEYLVRDPKLSILLCYLDYVGPKGNVRLQGRILMVVRAGFSTEVNGDPWVHHTVEAFVKVDSKGWRAVAATFRPLIERLLQDQVEEAGLFVSLMGRLVETYPDWASGVAMNRNELPLTLRTEFRELVAQTRRPAASRGRPALVEASSTSSAASTPVRR